MEDLLPDVSWKWGRVEAELREKFRLSGFQEIRTPVLEHVDLFHRSIGEETDIVGKEMYLLKDRNEEVLALRPEGTAPVARALIEHQWMAQREVEKLYYLLPFFRYERPQKGRLRQFSQYGVELLGPSEPLADAEVITFFWKLYVQWLGEKRVRCFLNSMGCSSCMPEFRKKLQAYLRPLSGQYCEDCQRRIEKNPMRVLDCKNPTCKQLNTKAPKLLDHLCGDCREHFNSVQGYLREAGVTFEINSETVRGLDYYTRTTFEFIGEGLGAQSALGGGGRYDRLFTELGAKQTLPAVGYAGGMERLMLLLDQSSFWENKNPERTLFLCHLGAEARTHAFRFGWELRDQGYDVHWLYAEKSLKAQMKQADRLGCHFCLILGDEELKKKQAPLKNLKQGSQTIVSLENTKWVGQLKL